MAERSAPRLWSDFDGTAVGLVSKTNWRNWTKYPLPMIEGYIEFLRGVQSGGVEIAGIVSRRPNISPRRVATVLSIARLGLDEYFPYKHQVVLTGSEDKKGEFVAAQAKEGVVGMIEDKPHKLGRALVNTLLSNGSGKIGDTQTEIVLGATTHPHSEQYIEQLAASVTATAGVRFFEGPDGQYIEGANFGIHVVTVEPYSVEAGQAFAATLTNLHNTR